MKFEWNFNILSFVIIFFCILFSTFSLNFEGDFYQLKNNICSAQTIPGANAGGVTTDGANGSSNEYNNLGTIKSDNFLLAPLVGLLRLEGILIAMSVDLIAWTLSPDFLNILDNPGIYKGWSTVRDFLNIFFIFFLLFSAFSTVFQVSKYHIRSTWVMIIVMALLVNFSWPITRVMIDVSNLAMIQIIGVGGDSNDPQKVTSSLMTQFGTESEFLSLMLGGHNLQTKEVVDTSQRGWFSGSYLWQRFVEKNYKEVTTVGGSDGFFAVLFFGIIAGFIFLITFLSAALLLVIRIIVLAVLLIFASVGFTLAAFPSTRSYASQWWSAVMKQLIVGPVLLFCLIVSAMTLKEFNLNLPNGINSSVSGTTQMLLNFSVTIILIWSGIILASRVGAEGSGMAFGFANKAAAWGRRTLKRGSIGAGVFVGRRADMAGGKLGKRFGLSGRAPSSYVRNIGDRWKNVKEAEKKKYEGYIEESKAHGMNAMGGKFGGDKNALKNLQNKKVAEMKKKWKDDSIDTQQLADKMKDAKGAELQALVEAISEKKDGVDDHVIRKMASRVNEINDSGLIKAVNKKAAETGNAHVAYGERLKGLSGGSTITNTQRQQASKEIYGNMDAKTYAKQRETIMRAAKEHNSPGSEVDYAYVEDDLRTKLNRASFARDMHNADTETYENLEDINGRPL